MQKSHIASFSTKRGFTLTELAIVLVIVALLLAGAFVPLSAQRDAQARADTQKRMDDIKDALLGFAAIHGRFPCPANPVIASGAADAGVEIVSIATGCTGGVVQGVLPWATLGLPETDAWGRRFTYRVTAKFANTTLFDLSDGDNGVINIWSNVGGTKLAANVPVVFISHGKNGLGAYLPSGAQLSASTGVDELKNIENDTDFVSAAETANYDDQTLWIAPAILMNRMIIAGKLPKGI